MRIQDTSKQFETAAARPLVVTDRMVIDAAEIELALDRVDMNKTAGPNGAHPVTLRPLVNIPAAWFAKHFTASLNTGVLPTNSKLTQVVPIDKGGRRETLHANDL
ncbi:hypothetical protein D915_005490 [Fasciola hepatica]|uniref:Uncharacterized protein n=1 Tax=Fasciola hepatica TaxID=6192 RepID=A0A4E0RYC6_FASHE|nr:hypothetical protein D915_005490 [Fasciola hepatica]